MPIYEYEHESASPSCVERIEVLQALADPPLIACPECGGTLRRVISSASFSMTRDISPDQVAKQGFTTYKKAGTGMYEKVAGEGVDTLKAD